MDLFSYRLIFHLIFIIFLYSCEETIVHDDEPDIDESSNFSIMGFSVNYDDNNDIISIYVETSSYENIISIESFVVNDINNDDQFTNNEIIDSNSLVQSEFNPNIFLYDGSLRLDNDVYIYDIILQFTFDDQTIGQFESVFTTNIAPKIISYSMTDNFQLDPTEWTVLPIDIEVENLNGLDNIESVKFEIKSFLNECNGDSPDPNATYESYPTWIFEYVNSDPLTGNHWYHVDFLMRPSDGSGLAYDGVCLDVEPADGICDGFEATDCGKTGSALFKFIVIDKDGLVDEVIDIPLEITE